jgi:hypothetical protein
MSDVRMLTEAMRVFHVNLFFRRMCWLKEGVSSSKSLGTYSTREQLALVVKFTKKRVETLEPIRLDALLIVRMSDMVTVPDI